MTYYTASKTSELTLIGKIWTWIFSLTVVDFQVLYFSLTNKEELWNPVFNTILSINAESNETEGKEMGFFLNFYHQEYCGVFFRNAFFFCPGQWVKLQDNFLPTCMLCCNCLNQMRNSFLAQDTELKWKLTDLIK